MGRGLVAGWQQARGGGQRRPDLYTSTDSGVTWTARDSSRGWQAVASSSDGNKLVAVGSSTQIYTSTDAGLNWTPRESARDWVALASSADGSRLATFAGSNGLVYTSAAGRSTLGTAGTVSCSQYDALTLQYVGGGEFVSVQHALTGSLHME